LKIRTQPSKVFTDTVNGVGAVAVPLGWAEVITAAQQGVIDGADLPVVNMVPLKAYEVSKYYSMTGHNYGSTLVAMNLGMWNALTPDQKKLMLDGAREAQAIMRKNTESIDTLAKAKEQHRLVLWYAYRLEGPQMYRAPNLDDYMTVDEMIRFTAAFFPRWRADLEQRYRRAFELPDDRKVKALSRGMRTKLALLLALCRSAELLILDLFIHRDFTIGPRGLEQQRGGSLQAPGGPSWEIKPPRRCATP
jgi:hypothetical protein